MSVNSILKSSTFKPIFKTSTINQPSENVIIARYFKLEIDAVRTSGSGVQMAEFHLYLNGVQVNNSGVVATNLDNFSGGFRSDTLFDDNLNSYFYSATEKNTITFTYPADITTNQYDWATAVNNIQRDPISWRLLYSPDNTTFILIDQQVNFPTTEIRNQYIPNIPIVRLINAQYFRYEIDAVRSSGSGGVQIAEILLYFNDQTVSNSGVVASNIDPFGRGFDAPSVFDNNIATYLYSATEKNIITFTYPNKITMNKYNLATAVNNIGRDPVSWRLLYSIDNVTFTLLDQQVNFPTTEIRSQYIPIIKISSLFADKTILIQLPKVLLWPVNMEVLLGSMYYDYKRFKIYLNYITNSIISNNISVNLSGLPFTNAYNLGGKNNSIVTIASITSFYTSSSIPQYYQFTPQQLVNIFINLTNLDGTAISSIDDYIFSFNIIGDENFKINI
jgi:hypothetical protein